MMNTTTHKAIVKGTNVVISSTISDEQASNIAKFIDKYISKEDQALALEIMSHKSNTKQRQGRKNGKKEPIQDDSQDGRGGYAIS